MRKIQFITIALIGSMIVLAPFAQSVIFPTQTFPIIYVIIGGIIRFLSTPITQWVTTQLYVYQAVVDQSNINWNLTAPSWLSINSTGLVSGTPGRLDAGNFPISIKATNVTGGSVFQNYTLMVSAFSSMDWTIILLVFAFIVLFIVGFFERFAMVGAAIVCAIIAVLGWSLTGEIYISTIFVLLMAVCIGLAITDRK